MSSSASFSLIGDAVWNARCGSLVAEREGERVQLHRIATLRAQARDMVAEIAQLGRGAGIRTRACPCCGLALPSRRRRGS